MECGGLLQVDQRTENYKYLFEAKIRTKKNSIGFLPEILTLTEGTETYHVKIRPISPAIRPTTSRQAQPLISVSGTVQVVAGGGVPTSQRHWRVVDYSQVNWARSNINEFDWLEKENRSSVCGFVHNQKVRGDGTLKVLGEGTSIQVAENLIIPPFMSALPDKATKENVILPGPINVEPILQHSAQVNPLGVFSSEPKLFQNIRSFSELGPNCGLEKNKNSDPQSKSDCTATEWRNKTRFLSKFGRTNGEGSRGFRKGLSHIDDRLSSASAPLQICSLPPSSIADRDDDDSISSICPESVDSLAKSPSLESEFVDEISSTEEKEKIDAFANEEGILHDIFTNPDEPGGANGYMEGCFPANIRSDEQMGIEADDDATFVPETIPKVLYYSRKRRKSREDMVNLVFPTVTRDRGAPEKVNRR
ncbi:hypothetical protein ACE6H2_016377 [Prunus campanulata]